MPQEPVTDVPNPYRDPAGTIAYERPDPARPASSSPAESQLPTESPSGSPVARHDPYAALRIRDYRLFWAGWVLSVIGQQIQEVAVGWDVFNRTRAEAKMNPLLALGLISGVIAVPIICLAIPAGELADRWDRRKIIMCSMIGAASASIWLAWLSHAHGSLPLMYLCLFLGAAASAMGWPARSALVPQIVPADVFSNAATWNSTGYQIASMAGPALGGLILYWSIPLAYLVDAACFLTFGLFLCFLNAKPPARKHQPFTLRSLAIGIRFVMANKIILATITLDLFAVLLGGAMALIPAFAKDILHAGPGGFGILRAAPAIGALLMGIWLTLRPPMKKAGRNLVVAVIGFGLATIVFGLSHNFLLSFLALLTTGACDNISVIVRHTLVQLLTPDSMRGRVSAVNNIFIGASNEIGGFESGLTGAWLGAVRSVVMGGVGTLATVGAVCGAWPEVLRFGSLKDAKPVEQTGDRSSESAAQF